MPNGNICFGSFGGRFSCWELLKLMNYKAGGRIRPSNPLASCENPCLARQVPYPSGPLSGPLPVNTIGQIVDLTPGSISIAVDRLFAKGLVTRVESTEDRRVRIIALTPRGKDLIVPAFRKHSGQMRRVFSELSAEELHCLEVALKKVGKRAAALIERKGTGS